MLAFDGMRDYWVDGQEQKAGRQESGANSLKLRKKPMRGVRNLNNISS